MYQNIIALLIFLILKRKQENVHNFWLFLKNKLNSKAKVLTLKQLK